jgi:hypothetical protein
MTSNLERYQSDLDKLISLGDKMVLDLNFRVLEQKGKLNEQKQEIFKKIDGAFENEYQKWYTESFFIIKYLLPDRLTEFEMFYKGEQKRKTINILTFTIQDWLMGVRASVDEYNLKKSFDDFATVFMRFNTQLEILKSIKVRFKSSLFEIKQLLQADLLDSELDSSKELLKNGYLRASGIIAGVVLETHLLQVCDNHGLTILKKNPKISDFNDILKKNDVFDVSKWRFIQRLGDIRNLCGHKKEREPLMGEVEELINGVDKITKTLF